MNTVTRRHRLQNTLYSHFESACRPIHGTRRLPSPQWKLPVTIFLTDDSLFTPVEPPGFEPDLSRI